MLFSDGLYPYTYVNLYIYTFKDCIYVQKLIDIKIYKNLFII
jgi:hypothetical protein